MQNELKVIYLPVAEVVEYSNNARTHSPSQVRQIARSILEYGFISPILIDEENTVIAGHGRILAARVNDLEVIPAIRVDQLSPAQVRAYRLADNKIAANAGWDDDLLHVELEFLSSIEIDFDLSLTGFSVTEADLLLGAAEPLPEEEFIPEIPPDENVIVKPGDVYQMDQHRIICGDCRDTETVDQLMADSKASMALFDAPYNVKIDGHVSGLGKNKHREFAHASGEMSPSEYTAFLTEAFQQHARVSINGSLHFSFSDWRHLSEMLAAGNVAYDSLINLCVWVKSAGGMGSLYRSQHEIVLVFKSGKKPHCNNVQLGANGRNRTNAWFYPGVNTFGKDRDESLAMHPTVKPVQMLADAILDVTRRGEIVLDGFAGSGSTLLACEQTGRIFRGVEIDPAYVQVIIKRWEKATGKAAIRESDGLTFQEALGQHAAEEA
jgi:DNA modification methylase